MKRSRLAQWCICLGILVAALVFARYARAALQPVWKLVFGKAEESVQQAFSEIWPDAAQKAGEIGCA